jgi:GntR family transcriptional regulator
VNIHIRNSDERPIYEQIGSQIKAKILSGELAQGDALPSMRLLAKELRISVITTKRAYEELERDGFIASVVGKGSFVAARNVALVREENLRNIEDHLRAAIRLAAGSELSLSDLRQMLEIMAQEESSI